MKAVFRLYLTLCPMVTWDERWKKAFYSWGYPVLSFKTVKDVCKSGF